MTERKPYRQAGAAFLLLLLLCTAAVQLTHSHTVKRPPAKTLIQQHTAPLQLSIATEGTDARCFVHEYQLAKDADFYCFTAAMQPTPLHAVTCIAYQSPLTAACGSYFENRGPPAAFAQA